MHRSNFAVEERIFQRTGPSPAMAAAQVAADIVRIEDGKLAEHWVAPQDEATKAQTVSGPPMFGDRFPESSLTTRCSAGPGPAT
jgi:hypothetical protein